MLTLMLALILKLRLVMAVVIMVMLVPALSLQPMLTLALALMLMRALPLGTVMMLALMLWSFPLQLCECDDGYGNKDSNGDGEAGEDMVILKAVMMVLVMKASGGHDDGNGSGPDGCLGSDGTATVMDKATRAMDRAQVMVPMWWP